jgi:LysR family transcriptional regulator, hydrogen peroxide-inducible genes activator
VITLTQLQYIVAVDRHGTFRAAAKACFVTQPTLSMQVKKLEEDLGVQIFDRSEQPVRATPLGKQLIEQSAIVLSHAARLEDLVHEARDKLEGDLRLAVIPTLAPYLLPLFVEHFAKRYPKVHLRIEERTTDSILDALRKNEQDIGLLATPLGEPMVRELPLFREPFYVYAAKDSKLARLHEVADVDLKDERVLLLSEGHCLRSQVVRVCGYRQGRNAKPAPFEFESGSIETLCHMVDKGLGYTVIPHLARGWSATRNGRVIPFSEPRPSREVSLVAHQSFAREGLLRALAESIRESLPSARPWRLRPWR